MSAAAPPLSVCMAVHNGMPFVEESVRSILAQSHADFEFVIGDDGSTDGTGPLLDRFAAADPRIRLLRRPRKSGLAHSANWVVGEARAPLVAIMHADDRALPQRLARSLAAVRAQPDTVLVGSLAQGIDEQGRVVRPPDYRRLLRASPFAPFPHSSILFSRASFDAAGGYRAAAEYWEDLDLYYRLARLGPVRVIPEVLAQVRHSRISTRLRDDARQVQEAVDLMYRCALAHWRGESHDAVLAEGPRRGEALLPRTFVGHGATELWMGERPDMLAPLLRRGRLMSGRHSLRALAWTTWAQLSPRTLRAALHTFLRLNVGKGKAALARRGTVEWQSQARR